MLALLVIFQTMNLVRRNLKVSRTSVSAMIQTAIRRYFSFSGQAARWSLTQASGLETRRKLIISTDASTQGSEHFTSKYTGGGGGARRRAGSTPETGQLLVETPHWQNQSLLTGQKLFLYSAHYDGRSHSGRMVNLMHWLSVVVSSFCRVVVSCGETAVLAGPAAGGGAAQTEDLPQLHLC